MAGKRDIQLIKGDDYSHVITITNSTGAIDITGRTYSAQVRRVKNSTGNADATFTCVVTNAIAGEVTIMLTDIQTDLLSPINYWWDFQENAGGIITTLLAGRFKVLQDVTR